MLRTVFIPKLLTELIKTSHIYVTDLRSFSKISDFNLYRIRWSLSLANRPM